jgi:ParB-like chromosome segregation protein Spo0J
MIETISVRELRPHPNNARTHSKKQIRQIAKSIEKFGFCNPVLVDDAKRIIAGHGRVEAAKLLGIDAVPTCRLSHLSDADKRAYVLADNKLAEKAAWDRELLAIELQGLIELEVDIELTGFEMAEIDLILEEAGEASGAASGPEDTAPEPSPGPAVSQTGDCGCSVPIACCVEMRATKPPTIICSQAARRNSCSPIRPTTLPSMAMSAASAAFVIATSPWAAAR